jgi:hypothetical protein
VAGLVPATHVFGVAPDRRRGCPEQVRARGYQSFRQLIEALERVSGGGVDGGALPAIEHRLGVGRAVDNRDLAQRETDDDVAVGGIARGDMAANREALVDAGDDLAPGVVIDDAGAEIEPLVVDRGLLGDADRGGLVHLADIGKAHVILERGGERVAADHLALLVLRLGRGVAPYHVLLVIELLDRPIKPHHSLR